MVHLCLIQTRGILFILILALIDIVQNKENQSLFQDDWFKSEKRKEREKSDLCVLVMSEGQNTCRGDDYKCPIQLSSH